MADASSLQTSFLGGEWSPYHQGRADDPTYHTALNVCRNSLPVEEGAWQRRSGTRFAATTRNGAPGVLRAFDFTQSTPFNLEFTAGHIRFFSGPALLVELNTGVVGITTATPAKVITSQPHGWNTGDQVEFHLADSGAVDTGVTQLLARQFAITKIDANNFTIADPITGAGIDGTTVALGANPLFVARVVDLTTPYTANQLQDIRLVQNEQVVLILHNKVKPYSLSSAAPSVVGFPVAFTFASATFKDGPYLDPPTDGSTLTPSAVTGSITLTASSTASINGGLGFRSTDVGRLVRLFSEPLAWAVGTAYAKGALVKFSDTYWQALLANTGKQPDLDVTNWAISTTAAAWTWGTIGTVTDTTHVIITLAGADPTGQFAGGDLLYTNPIKTWRLGKYSDTSGWPTAGCYHENRFWLTNAANEFDASVVNGDVNGVINFCPTTPDGTVADNMGISEKIKTNDVNTIYWMMPDHSGVILGTQGGEFLIQSSNLNEPITPTSIKAIRVTKYGCENIEPRRTGLSSVFVQRYGRKLLEYVSDVYSGKFSGTNISLKAKHLALTGIKEVAYVAETTPVVWARTADGSLAGMTYKRESPFSTQPASFAGWHRHDLGSSRVVESIQGGPAVSGAIDALAMVTNDPITNIRWVEFVSNLFGEGDDITIGFFVDGGSTPVLAKVVGQTVVLYGLHYVIGKTVTVTAGGLDLGDHLVAADGTVTVTFVTDNPLFTAAYLATLTASGSTFNSLGITILNTTGGPVPVPTAATATKYADTTGTVHGISSTTFAPDWDGNKGYAFSGAGGGSGPNDGFYCFNLTTGAFIAEKVAQCQNFICFHPGDGYLYTQTSASNQTPLTKLNPGDLSVAGAFGAAGSGFGVDATHFHYSGSMVGITAGTTHFIVSCSALGSAQFSDSRFGEVAVINVDTLQWTGFHSQFSERRGLVCRGPTFNIGAHYYASAYIIGRWTNDGNTQSDQIGLYVLSTDGRGSTGMVNIATILSTTIDATFDTLDLVGGPMWDETDNNVMLIVGRSGVYKLIKLNTTTGAVMWTIAVTGYDAVLPNMDNTRRIRNGRLILTSGAGGASTRVYLIDTIAGTETHFTATAGVAQSSTSNAQTGQIVFFGSSTPASFTNKWGTLGPLGTTPAGANYFGPFTIGFTYTSQGQRLRGLSPEETGARNGPALGKTRRIHQHAALVANTQGISFGADFNHLNASPLLSAGGTIPLTALQMKQGIIWTTVDDQYSFDGQLCWQISRPYPASVLSVQSFLHTQDR